MNKFRDLVLKSNKAVKALTPLPKGKSKISEDPVEIAAYYFKTFQYK